jgi:hypothetical protein
MLLFAEIWSNKKHLVEHIKLEKVYGQRGKVVPTFERFIVNSNGHEFSIFSESTIETVYRKGVRESENC